MGRQGTNLISSPLGGAPLGNLRGHAGCGGLEAKQGLSCGLVCSTDYADVQLYLLAYVMVWRMLWLHSHNTGLGPGKSSMRNNENTLLKLRKSSKILERPIHSKKETQTFVIMVKVNGQKAVALLDSGCTTDAVTPELTRIAGLKIYKLKEQVLLQLGTRGSQSKINYGTKACIKYGPVELNQYFNIVNINRYNVTLGTVFMRKHGIILNFKRNQVRIGDRELPTLHEDTDKYLQICRQAMRNRIDVPKKMDMLNRTDRSYRKSNRH